LKLRDLIRALEAEGWELDRIRGSHRQFVHHEKPELGTITVAGHPGIDLPKGTENAILKQAGLKRK
jgi:predicted RNA binding protein YcfA (HicA-like mRNA interferase family)